MTNEERKAVAKSLTLIDYEHNLWSVNHDEIQVYNAKTQDTETLPDEEAFLRLKAAQAMSQARFNVARLDMRMWERTLVKVEKTIQSLGE